jgi:hypothetical protein
MRNGTLWLIAICVGALSLALPAAASASSTDQVVNDTRSFIEWAFGFKLTPALVQTIREGTTIDMSSDAAGVQATVKDINTVMAWVHKHRASDSLMLRSLIEPQLIAAWQGDTSASAATGKALVEAWRNHNQIIADGTPPLRRSVVDAYIGMFEFISKQAGKSVPAGISNHEQFAKRVAGQYPSASPEAQLQFNKVQTLWLSLQTIWARSTPSQQAALRQQWRGYSDKPVAVAPRKPATQQSQSLSRQTFDVERYKEKLFVDAQQREYFATWTNPMRF